MSAHSQIRAWLRNSSPGRFLGFYDDRAGNQGVLTTLSMTTLWLATLLAVYDPVKEPRSLLAQRSRTVAAPVGMPIWLH